MPANEISKRLRKAADYLKRQGIVQNDTDLAKQLDYSPTNLSMAINGVRTPSWQFLLDFCDRYNVSFDWLRTGAGTMFKENRELLLLKRIEELEKEIEELKMIAG